MIKGSVVALVTPFDENLKVNFAKLEELLQFHIKNGTDGILILGTTGEASTLSEQEKDEVVQFCVQKLQKKLPLIVGIGSNNTQVAVRLAEKYSSMGADYLLAITPYYNKTNSEGLEQHFFSIANASSVPVILYNVPSRTGMKIPLECFGRLSSHKNICGIKEASGDISYAMEISKFLSEDFVMFSGNDDIIVPMMSLGAVGVISVLANIAPKRTHEMCSLCLQGEFGQAMNIQKGLLDVTKKLFVEVNPIPVKEAMNQLGFNVGACRMPLFSMDENNKKVLCEAIKNAKKEIF